MASRQQRLLAAAALALPVLLFCAPFLFTSHSLNSGDLEEYYWPQTAAAKRAWEESGRILFWNPAFYAGAPYYGSLLGGEPYVYPPNWILLAVSPERGHGLLFAFHMLVSAWGMYRLCRTLRLGRPASVFTALAYTLSFQTAARIASGHVGSYPPMALTPLLLFLLIRTLRRPAPREIALLGSAAALLAISGHPQHVYHTGLLTVLALLAWTVHRVRQKKPFVAAGGAVVLAGILGAALAAVYLLPALENSSWTVRRPMLGVYADGVPPRHHAFVWENFVYGLVPNFPWSSGARALYDRDFWHEKAIYLGVPTLLFAAWGIVARRRREAPWLVLLAILTVLDAMARDLPFHSLFSHLLPGYESFRVPGRVVSILVLCGSLLAGFGVDDLLRRRELHRYFLPIATAILLGAGIGVAVVLRAPLEAGVLGGATALSGAALLLMTKRPAVGFCGAAALVVLDLTARAWMTIQTGSAGIEPAYASRIGDERSRHRILDTTSYGLGPTRAGFRLMRGYGHGLLSGTANLYARAWADPLLLNPSDLPVGTRVADPSVFDDLNVRWIQSPQPLCDRWTARGGTLYENPGAKGFAFLIGKGSVSAVDYATNEIHVSADVPAPTPLVISESWMPGWSAKVNGTPVKVERYQNALMRLDLPTGALDIRLRYRPTTFVLGGFLSGISLILLIPMSTFRFSRRVP